MGYIRSEVVLAPCPFCGGKRPKLLEMKHEILHDIDYAVICMRGRCRAAGPSFTRYAEFPDNQPLLAAEAWNKRNG